MAKIINEVALRKLAAAIVRQALLDFLDPRPEWRPGRNRALAELAKRRLSDDALTFLRSSSAVALTAHNQSIDLQRTLKTIEASTPAQREGFARALRSRSFSPVST